MGTCRANARRAFLCRLKATVPCAYFYKELDPDDGELTRTRKVRCSFVAEKYADLVAALYSQETQVTVETQMTFEDGRRGLLKADLQICTVAGDVPLAVAPR